MSTTIRWFLQCGADDLNMVGGKAIGLGYMAQAGFRVPVGFVITTEAYLDFIRHGEVEPHVVAHLERLQPEDLPGLEQASDNIRALIEGARVPDRLVQEIHQAYHALCAQCGCSDVPVAVRSSATAEDLPGASFAGVMDTFLWVRGEEEVLQAVRRCWAGLFNPRVLAYRAHMGFAHDRVRLAVVVQKMVNARAAGVMFTLNPINGDRSKIALNASWGLGESVVQGEVTPDAFTIDKVTLDIMQRVITDKPLQIVPHPVTGGVMHAPVPTELRARPSLTDAEILELARLGKKIERHYGNPQDIEWAVDADLPFPDNVLVLQVRPETVWSSRPPTPVLAPGRSALEHIVANLNAGKRVR